MDIDEARWRKIILFCAAVLVFRAGIWRSKELYDQYVHPTHFSALFVFGDSGNNNNNYIKTNGAAPANFAPYGKSFFHSSAGGISDGRTVFDFLATRLGVPFPPLWFQRGLDFDLSHGANFASAGSGLLDSTSQNQNVISFGRQVNEFRSLFYMLEGGSGFPAEQLLSGSIIAINIGANDIAGNYLVNASLRENVSPQQFIQSLLKAYEYYLLSLHEIGVRKFIVFSISPLGCTPAMRFSGLRKWRGKCDQTANELFQQFNSGLEKLVRHLNKNLKGTTLIYVNTYDLLLNIIDNGKTLGFLQTDSACYGAGPYNAVEPSGQEIEGFLCKNPKEYVFWDRFHVSERVQWMIAQEAWAGNSSWVSPFNLRSLI